MARRADEPDRPGAQEWVPQSADVETLRRAAEACRGCELWEGVTQVVFSEGSAGARMLLVGEQPGDREDLTGEPFVGPAGKVLEDALTEAEIDRGTAYVTNAVKHFRFERRGKRRIHSKPAVGHITACHPWLEAEVVTVQPDVIVALGATAARSVFGRTIRIGEARGTVQEAPAPFAVPAVVTVHPSSLLRLPDEADRRAAFRAFVADLRVAAEVIT